MHIKIREAPMTDPTTAPAIAPPDSGVDLAARTARVNNGDAISALPCCIIPRPPDGLNNRN